MDKTLTLQPFCITEGSGFEGIIGSNKKANISIAANVSMHVGFIGFTYDALHKKSSACVFKNLQVHFWQSGGDLAWLNWELTPLEASDFSVQGNRLISHTDNLIGFPQKTGSHDLDKWYEQRYDFKNANAPTDLFSSNMVVLRVDASNDAKLMPQTLWMRDLELTLKYTARYYARFYADNKLKETQTVEANKRATPPDVTAPDGYRLAGWKCGNQTYTASNLPTSEDTDLRFDAVWERIYYKVTLPKTGTASCRVTDANGSSTYTKSKDTDTTEKVTVAHGDSIKVYASGFNTRAQNLLVKVNGGTAAEKDGSSGGEVLIYEGAVTGELTFTITAKTVTFPLTITLQSFGGAVNAPSSITRYANAKITVQAYTGYCLDYVELDGTRTTFSGETGSWTHLLQNVSEPHTLKVNFKPIKVPISFNVGAHITVTDENGTDVTAGTSVDYGSSSAFLFSTSNGFSIDTVFLGNETLFSAFKKTQTFEWSVENVTKALDFVATETNDLVSITIQATTGGTVSGETGLFVKGRGSLQFRAIIDENYRLVKWFNNATESQITVEITSDMADTAVFAEFEKPSYKVQCIVGTNIQPGHLEPWTEMFPDSQGKSHDYYVDSGESVSVPYYLNEGGILSRVYVNVGGSVRELTPNNPEVNVSGCIITLTEESVNVKNVQSFVNLTFYFFFGNFKFTFLALPENKGTFRLSYSNDEIVIEGNEITLGYNTPFLAKAIPVEGWHFAYWSDDNSCSANPRGLRISGHDAELAAVFMKDQKKITVEAGEGGEATPGVIVEYGDDFLLEINADIGQKIADVVLDGVSIYDDVTLTRRGGRYLLQNITEHHTIKVTFAAKTYTNGRRLFDYWPPVIQRIRDMQEIARVQQPMIDELWDSVSWLMENQFIDSATEEAVILWEKELGIVPNASDTLRQRKARLKIKWVPHNRFTVSWLHEWLCSATGRNDIQWPYVPENTYGLLVHLPVETNWQAIYRDLELYKPCNIYLDPHVDMPHNELRILTGFAVVSKRRCEIKDEHQMEREEGL